MKLLAQVVATAAPVPSRTYGKFYCVLVYVHGRFFRPVGDKNAENLRVFDFVEIEYEETDKDERTETIKSTFPSKVVGHYPHMGWAFKNVVKDNLPTFPSADCSVVVVHREKIDFTGLKRDKEGNVVVNMILGAKTHTFKIKDRKLSERDISEIQDKLNNAEYVIFSGHRNFRFMKVWMLVGVI